MNTKLTIGIIVIVLGGIAAYFLFQNRQNPLSELSLMKDSESEMMGAPDKDSMVKDLNDDSMEKMDGMIFDYKGKLADVTGGEEVRGINTGGGSQGTAMTTFSNGEYFMLATFEKLPDPTGDDFYEGWVVRPDPFKFISTGMLEKKAGVYTNMYASGDDLTPFIKYVLTLEPNDGDPAPADHILEGEMVKVQE